MQSQNMNPGNTEGFYEFAGRKWIYPDNMAIRPYQKQAVEKALFHNAMIVLPTGFGKTFIAAVVMYNYFLWYPSGKVIFVAPTRPLVAQQIKECKKICGIPSKDCSELTGASSREKRMDLWQTKRVFFATPQVISNDLESETLPAKDVKCIIIDEAHRAQGGYAYVDIVRQLHERNRNGFRIVALSATPGSDIQKVQQVMMNLYISDVMFRSENSIDLMPYKNEKNSHAWTVELVGKHKWLVDEFKTITSPTFKQLHRAGLTFNADSIDKVAKFTLIKAMNSGATNNGHIKFLASSAISLIHSYELLTLYGIRVFYSHVMKCLSEKRNGLKTLLAASIPFDKMLEEIRGMFGGYVEPDLNKEATNLNLTQGHPKLVVVKDLLLKHFQENLESSETRAIVFTKYRESVYDIVQTLKNFQPVIKAGPFVGQGKDAKSGKGMAQREQIELMNDFKNGIYNVIVATCVAEEGLDIGEVDLIICYDTTSSPISSIQRRGRTGRKRSGVVQTLLTKGYEEKKLKNASSTRRQVEDQLFKRENYMTHRYKDAPRMVPLHITPTFFPQKIEIIESDSDEGPKPTPKRKRKKQVVLEKVCSIKKGKKDSEAEGKDINAENNNTPESPANKSQLRLCDLWESDASWD